MNRETALEQVGEGWSLLVIRYYNFLDIINCATEALGWADIEILEVEVSRGMLRIVAKHPDVTLQDILDKLSWAIERDSVLVCEVCGEKGYRRKTLPGSPNRCQPHYVELANRLADEGKI